MNVPGSFDALIAIVAIYLGLAVFCSHVNEQIAAFCKWRGEQLYLGVLNLLVGERGITDAIFTHPLVTASRNDPGGRPVTNPGATAASPYRPSFLDARNFSLAMWDTIGRATVDARTNAIAVDAEAASAIAAPDVLFADLKARVTALPAGDLQRQLAVLVNDAQGSYDRLLRSTDAWFDRQMDRVSGWYKRKTQWVIIAIAFVTVFLLGIDSIRIASRLYADPTTRAALVGAAANAVAPQVAKHVQTGVLATPNAATPAGPTPQSVADAVDDIFATIPLDTFLTGLTGGWTAPVTRAALWSDVLHVTGLLVTVTAAALGAPFWFDALSSLVNVRLAGPKPASRADPAGNAPAPAP